MKRIKPTGKSAAVKRVTPIVKDTNAVQTKVWKNNDVKIVDRVTCVIPRTIVETMMYLDDKFTGVEFSIFGICKVGKDNRIILEDTFYIPEQEVTSGEVDYKEDAPAGFNCVIHKHPSGVKNFSATDDTYINNNFDYSLLWVDGKFETGQVRIKTPMGYIKVKMSFSYLIDTPSITEDQLKKITKKKYVAHQYGGSQHGGYIHGSGAHHYGGHVARYGEHKDKRWVNGKWEEPKKEDWVKVWGDPSATRQAEEAYYNDVFQGRVKQEDTYNAQLEDVLAMFEVESIDDLDEADIQAMNALGYNFKVAADSTAEEYLNSVD